MSAQPATTADIIELDTSRIYQPPPKPVAANPILEAEPEAYQPPPGAVLNRPEPKKRQRKAKGTGKKPGRPPRAKAPDPGLETKSQEQAVATPPSGSAPPRHPFFAKPVSTTTGWAIFAYMFALGVGAALGFWATR